MNPDTTPTPRTDAKRNKAFCNLRTDYEAYVYMANHAETIERELAASEAENAKLRELLTEASYRIQEPAFVKEIEDAPTPITMNPHEMNKRIAIACGWTHVEDTQHVDITWPWGYPPNDRGANIKAPIPCYRGDLNAMHEVENELDGDLCADYTEYLHRVVNATMGSMNHEDMRRFRNATAAQRAEAFLRTIGKWEDEK